MQDLQQLINSIEPSTPETLRKLLTERIADMMVNDFAGLVELLYRLDINEQKLVAVTEGHAHEEKAKLIATLIIERQLEKARTRKQYRDDRDAGGEERW